MQTKELIAKFEIPQYLREIEVSKKQRPKYYYWDGTTIKAKGKKLLQKYINPDYKKSIVINDGNVLPYQLIYPYFIVAATSKSNKVVGIYGTKIHSEDGKYEHTKNIVWLSTKLTNKQKKESIERILINIETKERVIANSTQAGKPKRIIIKGQDMYSGVLNEFTRAKIVNELKDSYYKSIDFNYWRICSNILENIFELTPNKVYIELEIVDTIKNYYDRTKEGDGIRWDVGNRAYPYLKTFVDFLVNGLYEMKGILPDDDRLHVMGEGYFFTPCNEHKERKLIFKIYKV